MMINNFKEVEAEVLEAFQEEIPSIYYSDKSEQEFLTWKKKMNYLYHDLLNFPPRLFEGQSLLDLGAGTGENTVYFGHWGAKCTLVEINDKAHAISKNIFAKYSNNYEDHNFVLSSLFEYETSELFDIVHARGVFAHSNDPESAFSKLASFLKPGGYLIYGDGNKSGNFQNMLQRMLIFEFADNWEDMVVVAEALFKEDIDRAQKFAGRSRRCIIFDKWVVPRLTNPTVAEVLQWFSNNNIKLYSSTPPITPPVLADSPHHHPKFAPQDFVDIGVFSEAFWLIYNDSDCKEAPKTMSSFSELAKDQIALVDYIDDYSCETAIDFDSLDKRISNYQQALTNIDLTSRLVDRSKIFFDEIRIMLKILKKNNLQELQDYLSSTTELFRGGQGIRHIDFIGYKIGD